MTPIDFLKDTIPMYLDVQDKEYAKEKIIKLLEQAEKFFKNHVDIAYESGKLNYQYENYYNERYEKNK